MNIEILAVGKLKESYLKDAVKEYSKRLHAYCKLTITEIPEIKKKDPLSQGDMHEVLKKEGAFILQKLKKDTFCVPLVITGDALSSVSFAQKINGLGLYGNNHLTFIIGGSYGLSPQVVKEANLSLSFSSFTFPHQLMRVLLLEQIYRAFKINANETYHK